MYYETEYPGLLVDRRNRPTAGLHGLAKRLHAFDRGENPRSVCKFRGEG